MWVREGGGDPFCVRRLGDFRSAMLVGDDTEFWLVLNQTTETLHGLVYFQGCQAGAKAFVVVRKPGAESILRSTEVRRVSRVPTPKPSRASS